MTTAYEPSTKSTMTLTGEERAQLLNRLDQRLRHYVGEELVRTGQKVTIWVVE